MRPEQIQSGLCGEKAETERFEGESLPNCLAQAHCGAEASRAL